MLTRYLEGFKNANFIFNSTVYRGSLAGSQTNYIRLSFFCKKRTVYSVLLILKSPGCDDVNPHMLKFGSSSLANAVHELFVSILDTYCIPSEWKVHKIFPLNKKGNISDASFCVSYTRYWRLLFTIKLSTSSPSKYEVTIWVYQEQINSLSASSFMQ